MENVTKFPGKTEFNSVATLVVECIAESFIHISPSSKQNFFFRQFWDMQLSEVAQVKTMLRMF